MYSDATSRCCMKYKNEHDLYTIAYQGRERKLGTHMIISPYDGFRPPELTNFTASQELNFVDTLHTP